MHLTAVRHDAEQLMIFLSSVVMVIGGASGGTIATMLNLRTLPLSTLK
jgi:hypothetical protein